jgi:hypothetical protein
MALTWHAEGTCATVGDASGIQHTHRSVMLTTSLLWGECGPLPTTQGSICLWEKVLTPKASSSRGMSPVW